MSILTSGLKYIKYLGKTSKVGANVSKTLKETPPKELFCQKYWKDALDEKLIINSNKTSVQNHGLLNGINHHLILSPYPKQMDMKACNSNLTVREMIRETDFEFKSLKPTTKKMITYRCIGEKPEFFSEYKMYQKAKNIKKGDIITMREYAYATSNKNYAEVYLPDKRGIYYEIEIPEGSRVSRIGELGSNDEVVFPRSSQFECLDTSHIKDGTSDYILIKLRYIQPKEYWRT